MKPLVRSLFFTGGKMQWSENNNHFIGIFDFIRNTSFYLTYVPLSGAPIICIPSLYRFTSELVCHEETPITHKIRRH